MADLLDTFWTAIAAQAATMTSGLASSNPDVAPAAFVREGQTEDNPASPSNRVTVVLTDGGPVGAGGRRLAASFLIDVKRDGDPGHTALSRYRDQVWAAFQGVTLATTSGVAFSPFLFDSGTSGRSGGDRLRSPMSGECVAWTAGTAYADGSAAAFTGLTGCVVFEFRVEDEPESMLVQGEWDAAPSVRFGTLRQRFEARAWVGAGWGPEAGAAYTVGTAINGVARSGDAAVMRRSVAARLAGGAVVVNLSGYINGGLLAEPEEEPEE